MRELGTLCEIGASITSVLDREEVIQKILDGVIETLGFDRAMLLMVDEEAGLLRSRASAGLTGEALTYFSQMEYELSRDDVAVVLTVKENQPILVEDVDDPPVSLDPEAIRRIGIRSFVTTPLRAGGHRIGVLVADRSGAGERVTKFDQRLLMGFGDQAAIALENARLYGEALEKQKLEEEVAVAARIQQHLLPSRIPQAEGFEVAGTSRPSRGVSGDYFDVIEVGDGRLWVALGDVCGKGIQAGLTMATPADAFPLGDRARSNAGGGDAADRRGSLAQHRPGGVRHLLLRHCRSRGTDLHLRERRSSVSHAGGCRR
jgi:sigma-B regulation protein RsbU (phosphoserine phosphatase)